jgi:hypothetical protein
MKMSPAGRYKREKINEKLGQSSDAITFVFTCWWTIAFA